MDLFANLSREAGTQRSRTRHSGRIGPSQHGAVYTDVYLRSALFIRK